MVDKIEQSILDTADLNYSDLQIASGITRLNGGYYKFGRIVVLSIVLQVGDSAVNLSGKSIINNLPPAGSDYGNNQQIGAVTIAGVGLQNIDPTSFPLVTYTNRALVYGDHTKNLTIAAGTAFSLSAVYVADK